ncbi:PEP-CTERM sorting domain-containing protein [Microseira sp. BLCC-F43]
MSLYYAVARPKDVPEPSSLLGISTVLALAFGKIVKHKQ